MEDPRRYLPGGPPQHRQAGIMAWFHDEDAAAAAERELRQAGYEARRDRIGAEGGAEAELDLAAGLRSRLDAPGPVLVAVAVDGDRYDGALAIVRRHGGEMAP
jgi:hypothetical protein